MDRRERPRRIFIDATGRLVPESLRARFLSRCWYLIAYGDTRPTRLMLAIAASCWAVFLAWPGDTFARPAYFYMKQFGPESAWASLWALHAAGMWWRTFADVPRKYVALVINSLGVVLFWGATLSIFFTLTYPLPAAIATDVVLSMASFWVLVRTHVNSAREWSGD